MSEPRIRDATPEDAQGVAVVHVEAWRAAYVGLLPASVLDDQDIGRRSAMWTRWIAASLTTSDGFSCARSVCNVPSARRATANRSRVRAMQSLRPKLECDNRHLQ